MGRGLTLDMALEFQGLGLFWPNPLSRVRSRGSGVGYAGKEGGSRAAAGFEEVRREMRRRVCLLLRYWLKGRIGGRQASLVRAATLVDLKEFVTHLRTEFQKGFILDKALDDGVKIPIPYDKIRRMRPWASRRQLKELSPAPGGARDLMV